MKVKYNKYQIIAQLSRNYFSSISTYKAIKVDDRNKEVILKIFKFNEEAKN